MMIFQLNNPLNKPRFKYFPCNIRDMLPFSSVLRLVLMSLLTDNFLHVYIWINNMMIREQKWLQKET